MQRPRTKLRRHLPWLAAVALTGIGVSVWMLRFSRPPRGQDLASRTAPGSPGPVQIAVADEQGADGDGPDIDVILQRRLDVLAEELGRPALDDRKRALVAMRDTNWTYLSLDVTRAVGPLQEALEERPDAPRALALEAIASLGTAARPLAPRIQAILVGAREPMALRMLAAAALGVLAPAGEPALVGVLEDARQPTQLRIAAGHALVAGCGQAAAAVERAVGDGDPLVRLAATESLGWMGHRTGAPAAARRALAHPDPEVRQAALGALAEMGPFAKEALPELRTALFAPAGPPGSVWAILQNMGPAAVPLLTEALDSGRLRGRALTCLGDMRERAKGAIPRLRAMAAAGGPDAPAASRALREIGPSLAEIAAALEDAEPAARRRALAQAWLTADALQGDAAELIPALRARLADPEPSVRLEAPGVLAKMGAAASSCVDDIAALLSDAHPRVRDTAALALGTLAFQARQPSVTATARAALERAARDSNEDVRRCVRQSLSVIAGMARKRCPEEP
jgi:HEAT repeat protein